MSRIGKKPVAIPAAVKGNHNAGARTIAMDGPKGKMSYTWVPDVEVAWNESEREVVCSIPEARQGDGQSKAHWGTTRSRIEGMVKGVTDGFSKRLEVVGVGWNAKSMGKMLQLNVGYNKPVEMSLPLGVDAIVEGAFITVSGFDKQAVGQFAAEIRSKRKPEPYNGKGIKYVDEQIIRKQGKAFGA
ncbi:MAG: 50S ribosomal protein L6 [Phycisphaerales bacterium]